jgi:hypothetical protein
MSAFLQIHTVCGNAFSHPSVFESRTNSSAFRGRPPTHPGGLRGCLCVSHADDLGARRSDAFALSRT